MKNPFHKVPSYLNKKKKVSVEKYFNEIKDVHTKEIDDQLKLIDDTIKRVKDFEKDTKIDGLAKMDYTKDLSIEFANNPTELGVFKAKNDLANKLSNEFIYSEKAGNVNNDVKWLVDGNNGIRSLDAKLDKYARAFKRVKGKYTEGKIDASYNEHLQELRKKVFEFKNSISTQEFDINDVSDLNKNIKDSYYDILNSTPLPEVQKSITSPEFNLPELSVKGTNHPNFDNAYAIQKPLNTEVKIERAHTQFQESKSALKKRTNKKGQKKELRFNDVVDVRKIPNEGHIDYYFPSREGGKTTPAEDKIKAKAKSYRANKNNLKSFKHVQHDFKDESVLDDNSLNANVKNTDSIDKSQDGTMKLSDKPSLSDFTKPLASRNVTVHTSAYIDNRKDVPHRDMQAPTTSDISIDFNKFMNNPSLGNDNDRLLLANMNRMGKSISYNKIDEATGKKEKVNHKSFINSAKDGGPNISDKIRNQAKKDENKNKKRRGVRM